MRTLRHLVSTLLLGVLAACSANRTPDAGQPVAIDAGDAGDVPDAGHPPDAGPRFYDAGIDTEPSTATDVSAGIERHRADAGVVALAALVWRAGKITFEGAAGVRKLGDPTPVTTSDVWHLASCGKAMTATLTAISVEKGELSWATTLGGIYGANVHPSLRDVTLTQLLQHRGGLRRSFSSAAWQKFLLPGEPSDQRRAAVSDVLLEPAAPTPGSYAYSNVGYVIVGDILERATGQRFESLLRDRLFTALGMSSCIFGLPHDGTLSQPWGHQSTAGSAPKLGVQLDTVAESPAGAVSCSLHDWLKFVVMHVRGDSGEQTLVSAATMAKLHAPATGGDYAMGWSALQRTWANGQVLTHSGSISIYSSVVWAAPVISEITLAATNQDDDGAVTDTALDQVSTYLSVLR
jgi:D-alanyl-D-alanine carboxypeptidase